MAWISPLSDGMYPAKMQRERRGAGRGVHVIVNHLMEASETLTRAEDLGRNYFNDPRDADGNQVYASTHYGVDANSIATYVAEDRCAYGSHGNDRALHMEHAGFNAQTMAQWTDLYSLAMLDRSARWAADVCKRHGIRVVWLDDDALSDAWGKPGPMGITDHWTMTRVLGGGRGHVDHFPLAVRGAYMVRVARYRANAAARPVIMEGDYSGKPSLGGSSGRPERGDIPATGAPADLQQGLVDAGIDIGNTGVNGDGVDGDCGPLTMAGVVTLRRANRLSAVPMVNDSVWALIDAGTAPKVPPVVVPPVVVKPTEPTEPPPSDETVKDRIRTAQRHALSAADILGDLL